MRLIVGLIITVFLIQSCAEEPQEAFDVQIYQTSAKGDKLKPTGPTNSEEKCSDTLDISTTKTFQTIEGFGGAFTESSASLLNELSDQRRKEIVQSYFSESGANYSLTRTHMNSCDFSLSHYSYAPEEGDTLLENFSVKEDQDDIIPMIKDAQRVSSDGFKIVASPWTAPPWMKDNRRWEGGKLLRSMYPTWAEFFAKYAKAYQKEGIDIWAFTVENEPLGNGENWESMHYTPQEMADFVKNHLGPTLKRENLDQHILIYDQNKDEDMDEWVEIMLNDEELAPWIYGTAVHWYGSTVDWGSAVLKKTHTLAPDKHIIHSEACVDAEVPVWQDDQWYWSKNATDWGWDWAPEEKKANHPKYVPAYRYARDIIGSLNNWVEGWIDWNMVLDKRGGPNHASNWCVAPIIVDPQRDEVYYTPLYYVLSHFSKFLRPGQKVIEVAGGNSDLMSAATVDSNGNMTLVILNMTSSPKQVLVNFDDGSFSTRMDGQSLQTALIRKKENKNRK